MDEFGKMLRNFIKERGLSQVDFATKSKTNQTTISAICNGKKKCGITLAARFARALGLQGKEEILFIAKASPPSWRGFDSEHGQEAIIVNAIFKKLKQETGIDSADIVSATQVPSTAKTIIVSKNGQVASCEFKILKVE